MADKLPLDRVKTVKVRALSHINLPNQHIAAGTIFDLPEMVAKEYVSHKIAAYVSPASPEE